MNDDIRQSIAATAPRVDDAWFGSGSFKTFKHPTPISYETTTGNDYIVRHGAGDYGAVKQDIFAKTYDTSALQGK